MHPGATEIPYDGIDNDCDRLDVRDVDLDGHDAAAVGGDDCDDGDRAVHGGAPEIPYDGIDNDCSGSDLTDVDGDGVNAVAAGGDDCDDEDPSVGSAGGLEDGCPHEVTKTLGPQGGSLRSADQRLTLYVPPNTLTGNLALTVDRAPTRTGALGPVYKLGPSGTVFPGPVKVSLSLDGLATGGLPIRALRVAVRSGDRWTPLDSVEYDSGANSLSGWTTHFSEHGVIGEVDLFSYLIPQCDHYSPLRDGRNQVIPVKGPDGDAPDNGTADSASNLGYFYLAKSTREDRYGFEEMAVGERWFYIFTDTTWNYAPGTDAQCDGADKICNRHECYFYNSEGQHKKDDAPDCCAENHHDWAYTRYRCRAGSQDYGCQVGKIGAPWIPRMVADGGTTGVGFFTEFEVTSAPMDLGPWVDEDPEGFRAGGPGTALPREGCASAEFDGPSSRSGRISFFADSAELGTFMEATAQASDKDEITSWAHPQVDSEALPDGYKPYMAISLGGGGGSGEVYLYAWGVGWWGYVDLEKAVYLGSGGEAALVIPRDGARRRGYLATGYEAPTRLCELKEAEQACVPCPEPSFPIWTCTDEYQNVGRCIDGCYQHRTCEYGCLIESTGDDDLCCEHSDCPTEAECFEACSACDACYGSGETADWCNGDSCRGTLACQRCAYNCGEWRPSNCDSCGSQEGRIGCELGHVCEGACSLCDCH